MLSEFEANEEVDAEMRTEMSNLIGKYYDKAEWTNTGFQSVSSLIETYYWAMREGNLGCWMQCMSPKEFATWQCITKGRRDEFIAEFDASLIDVQGYRLESTEKFRELVYIITVKHTLIDRKVAVERFAVLKTGGEWKISGTQGMLKYQHHPADISKYDALTRPPNQR